jgi:tRNA dimethylallyltransferase
MTASRPRPVVAVVGPTATGKTALSVRLAHELGGEVVNADAMQLYRGMDIGTAKATLEERAGIPHHLVDVLDVTQEASVAAYQREARAAIAAVRGRGRTPILVGGSGLYVRAALDHLDIPPTDPVVRARLEHEYADHGLEALRDRLVRLDPDAAGAIEPSNARRIIRALEVVELTGDRFSARQPRREYVAPTVTLGLRLPRDVLDARIDHRVDLMWDAGLLDEVRSLVGHGIRHGRTASKALGYAQALAVLDGAHTRQWAVEETARLTRRFARRQESWFRPDRRITWLDATATDLVDSAVLIARTMDV